MHENRHETKQQALEGDGGYDGAQPASAQHIKVDQKHQHQQGIEPLNDHPITSTAG
jgi:hypothetical protein